MNLPKRRASTSWRTSTSCGSLNNCPTATGCSPTTTYDRRTRPDRRHTRTGSAAHHKYSDYGFDEIEPRLFRLNRTNVIKGSQHACQSDEYWAKSASGATHQEGKLHGRIHEPHRADTGLQIRHFGAKALIGNFVETGGKKHPSKFDFGPSTP